MEKLPEEKEPLKKRPTLRVVHVPPPTPRYSGERLYFCDGTTCDRRSLVFLVCAILTITVAIFSMVQLYFVDKCDNEIYVTLLTMTITFWCKPPQMPRRI